MDENTKTQKKRKKIARMGFRVRFGCNLKSARKSAHLSRAKLAELMNVSTRTIARYENDEEYPPFRMAYTLSKMLCFSLDALRPYELSVEDQQTPWACYQCDRMFSDTIEFGNAMESINQYIDSNIMRFDVNSNRSFLLKVLGLLQSSYEKKHNVLGISESDKRLLEKLVLKIQEIEKLFTSTFEEKIAINRLTKENQSLHMQKQELQKELDKLNNDIMEKGFEELGRLMENLREE